MAFVPENQIFVTDLNVGTLESIWLFSEFCEFCAILRNQFVRQLASTSDDSHSFVLQQDVRARRVPALSWQILSQPNRYLWLRKFRPAQN